LRGASLCNDVCVKSYSKTEQERDSLVKRGKHHGSVTAHVLFQ
jgi:hypothetical protein